MARKHRKAMGHFLTKECQAAGSTRILAKAFSALGGQNEAMERGVCFKMLGGNPLFHCSCTAAVDIPQRDLCRNSCGRCRDLKAEGHILLSSRLVSRPKPSFAVSRSPGKRRLAGLLIGRRQGRQARRAPGGPLELPSVTRLASRL